MGREVHVYSTKDALIALCGAEFDAVMVGGQAPEGREISCESGQEHEPEPVDGDIVHGGRPAEGEKVLGRSTAAGGDSSGGKPDAGENVPMWRAIAVHRGSTVRLPYAREGCRAYLAVAGGIAVPEVLGSFSTYIRAGIGGYGGRSLKAGDVLEYGSSGKSSAFAESSLKGMLRQRVDRKVNCNWVCSPWYVSERIRPPYEEHPELRVIPGREAGWFAASSIESFLSGSYRVMPQSDRMGYRLQGSSLELAKPAEMITESVNPGTIQVPPDGQPILLTADCQTTGGYPRIAHVLSVDMPLAAQVKPGGTLRFREVTIREAQEQLLLREMDLRLLRAGVRAGMAALGR